MNPFKIMGLIGLALCVVSAFFQWEYMALILLLLGLVIGVSIATEDSVRVIVTAAFLLTFANVLMNIPEVGRYLTSIFSAAGTLTAGGALTVISRNVWNRFKP
ncbi:MAG: hypothetical protein KF822_05960 [Steroidobacteraceae bacterium]|nr:hypothetical protein [Steroidobacteraceae bacterium]